MVLIRPNSTLGIQVENGLKSLKFPFQRGVYMKDEINKCMIENEVGLIIVM